MTPEQIAGQLTEEQPALSWRTVMDKIVEAMARAMCRAPGSLCVGFCHVDRCKQATEQHGDAARAALAVAAPMVLEMAANAKLPGRLTERTERAEQMIAICSADRLGATISFADEEMARLRAAVRSLKEQFNGNG